VRLSLTTSGSFALRLAPSFIDSVWLVNTWLPDMDGFDLLEMLRSLQSEFRIAMIDEHYAEERERRAIKLGAIQYVCKPVQLKWIWVWQGSDPPATRPIEHRHPFSSSSANERTL
jgi:DNA-binding response OmpR family regulator